MRLRPSQSEPAPGPAFERTAAHVAAIGEGADVRRLLPHRSRRLVGAWCFLDHFGPRAGLGVDVPTHPHIGLSTVTWLISGEVLHQDSLGSRQMIRPGQLNWMTAGHGICHSEESPPGFAGVLHGVQLWVAAPEGARRSAPAFHHHPDLPAISLGDAQGTVAVGRVGEAHSPVKTDTPLMALDLAFQGGSSVVPLDPAFEHALLVTQGACRAEGQDVPVDELVYLGRGRTILDLQAGPGSRVFLIGGEPLGEPILMWWNFVGRTEDEIAEARADWISGSARFGQNTGYTRRPRLEPPPLSP